MVLTLDAPAAPTEVETFAHNVATLSHGTLRIDIVASRELDEHAVIGSVRSFPGRTISPLAITSFRASIQYNDSVGAHLNIANCLTTDPLAEIERRMAIAKPDRDRGKRQQRRRRDQRRRR